MVAKIKSGKSLKGALNYNEHKVAGGLAMLIDAPGFQKDEGELSFTDKLTRLLDLALRNQRVSTNTLHVSLNFEVAETIDDGTLCGIARDYMEGIGFGQQPFLVYKHMDAGHPHMHVLTTNIDAAGKRISLHNLGKFQSETARKAIEEKYGLVRAEARKKDAAQRVTPAPLVYGKTDSKRALTNLVNEVCRTYQFTSLAEFNAVLSRFNVLADRGGKTSIMYQKNGLRYWITSPQGAKLGVPVKASSMYGKPTLDTLEKNFRLYAALRKPLREDVRLKLDQAVRKSISLKDLEKKLAAVGIDLVRRVNPQGQLYGLTFVDHRLKVVFNGSDLGKAYSAANLASRLQFMGSGETSRVQQSSDTPQIPVGPFISIPGTGLSLLDQLLAPEQEPGIPAELVRRKRKKRKRNHL